MAEWLQLSVEAGAARSVELCEWLQARGALSVSTESARPEEDTAWLQEATEWREPTWEHVKVTGLFDPGSDVEGLVHQLRARFPEVAGDAVRLDTLPDSDWSRRWRDSWRDIRVGNRLIIRAAFEPACDPAVAEVVLAPGLAFGTGSHATTALCLERLVEEELRGRVVLDFGCGSGILAIAALALGARRAFAVDVDPQALGAARENGARNGVSSKLVVCSPGELPDAPCADVIIANILANTLVRLAPRLLSLARPGAQVWLSGVLTGQVEAVIAAYAPPLTFSRRQRDGWALLTGS